MSEMVPDGWEETTLENLVLVDSESLKANTDPAYRFRYIDISCVSTGSVTPPSERIFFRDAPSRAKRIVRKNDVLIATVRPNLKAFAHFDEIGCDWVASTGFAVLRHKKNSDSRFIYNIMLSDGIGKQIDRLVAGSNYPAINSSDVKELAFLAPPLPEQMKIASILTSVDDVIETTQKQIDKLQDLKKATMNELLTKGIGHTEFKDSELGRIPKSWNVSAVGRLADVIDPQPDHRTPPIVESGVPYVGIGDITSDGDIDFHLARKVSEEVLEKQKKGFSLYRGAFLFGKIGTIGKPTILPEGRFFCLSANVIVLTTEDLSIQRFLFHVFSSSILDRQVQDQTNTTSQPALGIKKVRDFVVPMPGLEERNEIVSVCASIEHSILFQQRKLNQTQALKKSLMQDLLTGKVRVKVD